MVGYDIVAYDLLSLTDRVHLRLDKKEILKINIETHILQQLIIIRQGKIMILRTCKKSLNIFTRNNESRHIII